MRADDDVIFESNFADGFLDEIAYGFGDGWVENDFARFFEKPSPIKNLNTKEASKRNDDKSNNNCSDLEARSGFFRLYLSFFIHNNIIARDAGIA